MTDTYAGFLAYFASNVAFLYSPVIRSQYAARHPGHTPTVRLNDVVFALHASVISSITLSQYLARPAWGFGPSAGNRPSRFILGIFFGSWLGVLISCFIVASAASSSAKSGVPINPAEDWCEIDIVYALGYVKLVISLVKFVPQIITNYRNKSTRGWSIGQVTLDFAGGVLSTAQQGIDSWLQHDWSGITGNPIKFLLGNMSFVYDSIFFTQHYILYRGDRLKVGSESENDSLLGRDEENRRRLD